jgi:hypothetical protein
MRNRVTLCDPPSGWRYGFPKPLPDSVNTKEEIKDWLIKEGYPEKDIPLAMKHSRYWIQNEDSNFRP